MQQFGNYIDSGISINVNTLGHYGGFTDNFPGKQNDDLAHLCHDCTVILFNALPGFARFAEVHGGHPNINWKSTNNPNGTEVKPCCQYCWTWDSTDPKNTVDYVATPELKWIVAPKNLEEYYSQNSTTTSKIEEQ